jgi:WD40 repeat protein
MLIQDEYRFIQYYKAIIKNNPLQVYTSALIFCPSHCITRNLFQLEEPKFMITKPIMANNWNACLQTFEGHSSWVNSVAWSGNGSRVASASYDHMVKIWDPATGQCETTLNDHSNSVNSVAWSGDGSRVVSASYDCTVKIWDPATGRCDMTLNGHSNSVKSVAWSGDGSQVASASYDYTVEIWDLLTGQCQTTFEIGHTSFLQLDALSHYLYTDVGIFDLQSTATSTDLVVASRDHSIPLPQAIGYGLNKNKTWITYREQNLLWLPPEYRPSASALFGTTVAIGCSSGRVLILKFPEHICAP